MLGPPESQGLRQLKVGGAELPATVERWRSAQIQHACGCTAKTLSKSKRRVCVTRTLRLFRTLAPVHI